MNQLAGEAKVKMTGRIMIVKGELNGLVKDLKAVTPNADGLLLMKSIEKAQRQLEKIQMELGGLVL